MDSCGALALQDFGAFDSVTLKGTRLALDQLITPGILDDPAKIASIRRQMDAAQPFAHVVVDGLFDEALLDLLAADFPGEPTGTMPDGPMMLLQSKEMRVARSAEGAPLSAAQQVYCDLVNSGRFVRFLSQISGIDDLIVDHSLDGGGLHSTGDNGLFNIHCDFKYHRRTKLLNKIALITYLNRDWMPDNGGELELWDARSQSCAKRIEPVFGRCVIMIHSDRSFHGHPSPYRARGGQPRRSFASRYYINSLVPIEDSEYCASIFLEKLGRKALTASDVDRFLSTRTWRGKARYYARQITPPVAWSLGRRLLRRKDRTL